MKRYIFAAFITILGSTATAENVPDHAQHLFLRTVAHEMGHAVIREFDLPVMTSEEMIADDFATIFMGLYLPDLAMDATRAFAQFEIADDDREGPFSDYLDGKRRAARAVCLLYGMDPDQYGAIADAFGLSGQDAANCADTAPEITRSWRRILAPLMRPDDARITEIGVFADPDSRYFKSLTDTGTIDTAMTMLGMIDWHSLVRLNVAQCDGSAGWSRNGRLITVCGAYIARFIQSR